MFFFFRWWCRRRLGGHRSCRLNLLRVTGIRLGSRWLTQALTIAAFRSIKTSQIGSLKVIYVFRSEWIGYSGLDNCGLTPIFFMFHLASDSRMEKFSLDLNEVCANLEVSAFILV